MDEIILHHYPASPVSEKVRVALGIKNLAWRSVEIPRLPPKPDVMPLTGGYRRTPIMQIGADIYCDSQCILRELQRRHPEPSFYPGGAAGLPWGINRWTDALFDTAVRLSMGANADKLPPDFLADRSRLFFGPNADIRKIQADIPHTTAQLRAQFGWVDERLTGGRRFLLGDNPGLPDATTYYLVWFVRGRWQGGPELLAEFPALEAWEQRVKAIGHGRPTQMTSAEAIEAARASQPTTPRVKIRAIRRDSSLDRRSPSYPISTAASLRSRAWYGWWSAIASPSFATMYAWARCACIFRGWGFG